MFELFYSCAVLLFYVTFFFLNTTSFTIPKISCHQLLVAFKQDIPVQFISSGPGRRMYGSDNLENPPPPDDRDIHAGLKRTCNRVNQLLTLRMSQEKYLMLKPM